MEYIIAAEDSGRSVREILRGRMGVSYTALNSAKWHQRILLDGAPVRVNTRVVPGQTLTFLQAPAAPVYTPAPYPLPLTVPYEDEWLMIVDKPAPLPSQCSRSHPDDTLENALYARLGCPADFLYRPVNRLDKGTSGLMVIARDAHTQHLLQRMLHTEAFTRRYLAVTEGLPDPPAGRIDAPIGKENAATVRRIITPDGKPSITEYETMGKSAHRALLRLTLHTGRTHQIRVHLQHIGCPVCGDFLYGSELEELPGRFALHSAELTLRHPCTGETISLTSPLPRELAALLQAHP